MARAIRVRIRIDHERAELVSLLPVEVLVPGGDVLPDGQLVGLWIDLLDSTGKRLYSKVLDAPPDGLHEVFDPDGAIRRLPDNRPDRDYAFFVPDDGAADRRIVAVLRSDPDQSHAVPAEVIGRFVVR